MTLAFVGFHFVGAFVGKWLALETSRPTSGSKNPPERWSRPKALFWSHVALQVIGLALGTAGLVYGFEEFDIPYELVQYKHGVVGVWVMGLAQTPNWVSGGLLVQKIRVNGWFCH